ncbi:MULTISPECIES: DegV family protein [Bacillota]|uniref:Fatty acid-binding protein DegV n=2 Tax=Clostridiaceae TaxID=31979 RepID=V7IAD9_9CLOT|nr:MULTISPECIES: DegV family protein [Bacillota]EAD1415565.1 DegV family protein [Listeria monocytogenes]EAD1416047.1 DegV family protein [Listeria monocytogenes]EAD3992249.1 DegV family protein [Listeria monocytogenes]EAD4039543.1 DegV family protein [Listeria monocytogenes]EAD4832693.1 DegV family protein [Listeria monocytogenes]
MRTTLITDSNCDLPVEYLSQNNIHVIPFTYQLDGINYTDDFGKSLGHKEFYDALRNGSMPTTAQITAYTFENEFKKFCSKGESVIYIGFSSALSGSFNSSVMAKNSILEDMPEANITVIDSKSASIGQGLLVYYASEMLKKGKSKQEIVEWIENNKLKINHWFTIDSLDHLKRGGRISATSATIGGLLDVKPVLNVQNDGSLNIVKKIRGRKKSIKTLYEEYKARVINPEEQMIYINHGDCLEDAEYLKSLILSETAPKDIVINDLGPIIGTHTGPGMVLVVFIGKER